MRDICDNELKINDYVDIGNDLYQILNESYTDKEIAFCKRCSIFKSEQHYRIGSHTNSILLLSEEEVIMYLLKGS